MPEGGDGVDWGALLSGQVAPWGIVAFVVFSILTDRLVTKARLVQALAERDAWQRAYQDEKDTSTSLLAREREQTTIAATVNHLLESMPVQRGERQADDPPQPPQGR